MKRGIVYYGALPQDTDLLNVQKNAYVGLAKLAAAILGTNTIFHSLAATPGTGLSVSIGPGQVYSLANIDTNAYGSLAPDTAHQILKQGVNLDSTVLNVPAPGAAGQSINYLVQAQFQEVDGGPVVLPYYNSANPQVALSGQNNNGQAQNTYRDNIVALSVKAGTAAATGSQTTPAADSGWTGLYVVNVANGQTSISAGNITTAAGAPFLTNNLYNFSNGLKVGGRVQINGAADDGSTALQVAGSGSFKVGGGGQYHGALSLINTDAGGGGLSVTLFAQATAPAAAGDALIQNGVGNIIISPNAAGKAVKLTGGVWTNSPGLTVVDGGRVLIGTTADNGTDALQVNGSSYLNGSVTLTGGTAIIRNPADLSVVEIQAGSTAGVFGAILIRGNWNGSSNTGGDMDFQTAGATRMRVSSGGRLLINTTTDNGSDSLQVNGGIYATGPVKLGASGWVAPAVGTGIAYGNNGNGLALAGNGGTNDIAIFNKNANPVFIVPTGSTRVVLNSVNDNGVDTLQIAGDMTATGKIKENGNPIAPAGKITYFAQSTAPAGYLKANGAAISRTTYASLFSAIGTTFGAGDNSTTFNVPDLRGEFIRGFDDGRGVDSGRAFGSWQADQMGNHTHTYTEYGAGSAGSFQSGGKYGASTTGSNDTLTTNATGGTTNSNENRPRNVALLACIKY